MEQRAKAEPQKKGKRAHWNRAVDYFDLVPATSQGQVQDETRLQGKGSFKL